MYIKGDGLVIKHLSYAMYTDGTSLCSVIISFIGEFVYSVPDTYVGPFCWMLRRRYGAAQFAAGLIFALLHE